ncbi:unnamed protein product [Adineta steineri]|uniref:Peptidase C1A papain C-terminal domain-containing protein n=2 Tax=Adineta steineri TaxID=433720 RepID=A0A815K1X5_9BILA|nr:unnamed protein product [Adineta steineri]
MRLVLERVRDASLVLFGKIIKCVWTRELHCPPKPDSDSVGVGAGIGIEKNYFSETQYAKKSAKLISLSEQQLVDCSTKYGNAGCNGGFMDQTYQYIIDNHGIDSEDSYPYEAFDRPCRFNSTNVVTNISSFVDVKSQSEMDLQYAIATVGPIAVAIDAQHDSFRFYSSGVYSEPDCSSTNLDFSLLVVGYDTTKDNIDYYILKSQWTTQWGRSQMNVAVLSDTYIHEYN